MSHEPNWKYVEKLDSSSTSKQVLDVYDDYYGRYQCNVHDAPKAGRPAAKTKTPFKGLKEK
jgi:hypothetical protein